MWLNSRKIIGSARLRKVLWIQIGIQLSYSEKGLKLGLCFSSVKRSDHYPVQDYEDHE